MQNQQLNPTHCLAYARDCWNRGLYVSGVEWYLRGQDIEQAKNCDKWLLEAVNCMPNQQTQCICQGMMNLYTRFNLFTQASLWATRGGFHHDAQKLKFIAKE